jgi:hypothetical protein
MAPVNEREVYGHAHDVATVEASRALAEIRRRVKSGQPWDSATLALVRDRYTRARRDMAVAKALLAELDAAGDPDGRV